MIFKELGIHFLRASTRSSELVSAYPLTALSLTVLLFLLLTYQRRAAKAAWVTGHKVTIVIGADDGVGFLLAKYLDRLGHVVFAGCLTDEGAHSLQCSTSNRVMVKLVDISSKESIDSFYQAIRKKLGSRKLWAVVHNMHIHRYSPLEWISNEIFGHLLQFNVMGVHAATKTFLPLLRQSKGRVIFLTDPTAAVVGTYTSAQSVCNHAVDAYIKQLRREMAVWDVHIVEVRSCSLYSKQWMFSQMRSTLEDEFRILDIHTKKEYGGTYFASLLEEIKDSVKQKSRNYKPYSKLVLQAILASEPNNFYRYRPFNWSIWELLRWIKNFINNSTDLDLEPCAPSAVRHRYYERK